MAGDWLRCLIRRGPYGLVSTAVVVEVIGATAADHSASRQTPLAEADFRSAVAAASPGPNAWQSKPEVTGVGVRSR
jgi:hypothetical protein